MYEEIRLEKYNMERQALLEEQEAEMRTIQLEKTQDTLRDYKDAFAEYIAAVEEEENVNILFFFCTFNKKWLYKQWSILN